jgi:hypothetical protein
VCSSDLISVTYYLNDNEEPFETPLNVFDYTERSIAMTANEHFGKSFTDQLKEIGSYNPKLKIGKGWVFSKGKYPALQNLIAQIIDKKIRGNTPVEYPNVRNPIGATGPLGPLPVEPDIVSNFRNLLSGVSILKTGSTVFVSGEHTYIWGSKNEVYMTVSSIGKPVMMEFGTSENVIVLV